MIQKYSTLPWKKEDTDNLRGFLMTAKPNQALLNVLVDATHEIDYLNYTITGKDAEILRLRELLKEVKTDSTYWYKKYFLIPGSHENITMIIDAVATRHLVLMEKLKQEEV